MIEADYSQDKLTRRMGRSQIKMRRWFVIFYWQNNAREDLDVASVWKCCCTRSRSSLVLYFHKKTFYYLFIVVCEIASFWLLHVYNPNNTPSATSDVHAYACWFVTNAMSYQWACLQAMRTSIPDKRCTKVWTWSQWRTIFLLWLLEDELGLV